MTDTQKAQQLMAQLTGRILKTHAADRKLNARVDQLHEHHTQAAEGLGAAVRDLRGSALEDAYLTHAEHAAMARRLRDHRST